MNSEAGFPDSWEGIVASRPDVAERIQAYHGDVTTEEVTTSLRAAAGTSLAALDVFIEDALDIIVESRATIKKAAVVRSVNQRRVICNTTAIYELIYFILNVTAFYGYLLSILSFYPTGGGMMTLLKLGLTDEVCDFWGNFAGDLAWTIEPALALFVVSAHDTRIYPGAQRSLKTKKNKQA